jgi:XTP/dITP diphosphohydrolase
VTAAEPSGSSVPPGAAPPGARLLELVAIMDRLRTECPWDARQTHASLAPYLLEETYEALEALEQEDPGALREELGDVLLQVLFHARVAAERTDGTGFTIDDVADGIAGKLMRRHPHVFGDVRVSGAEEVKQNWEAIKAAEREAASGSPGSAMDGVPLGQPALALAAQLQRRAAQAGAPAELADLANLVGRTGSAAGSAGSAPASAGSAAGSAGSAAGSAGSAAGSGQDGAAANGPGELGTELFALVVRAREAGLDPELELRAAARAYRDRVVSWERSGREPGDPMRSGPAAGT